MRSKFVYLNPKDIELLLRARNRGVILESSLEKLYLPSLNHLKSHGLAIDDSGTGVYRLSEAGHERARDTVKYISKKILWDEIISGAADSILKDFKK